MRNYPITENTKITRLPKRGAYDTDTVYAILDEALFCTLAYVKGDLPFQLPTGFCRIDNTVYIHGSVGSGYVRQLSDPSIRVSVGVTLLDGIVLARSAFSHSMNYRSVALFSHPRQVASVGEKEKIMKAFTEKMCRGRWDDVRLPTAGEWKATAVIALPIEEASAKIRTGPPVDKNEDYALDVWAGVLPLATVRQPPVADPRLKEGIPLPPYLS